MGRAGQRSAYRAIELDHFGGAVALGAIRADSGTDRLLSSTVTVVTWVRCSLEGGFIWSYTIVASISRAIADTSGSAAGIVSSGETTTGA
jgi:hypothetical protein